jgi:hypothetical protein
MLQHNEGSVTFNDAQGNQAYLEHDPQIAHKDLLMSAYRYLSCSLSIKNDGQCIESSQLIYFASHGTLEGITPY